MLDKIRPIIVIGCTGTVLDGLYDNLWWKESDIIKWHIIGWDMPNDPRERWRVESGGDQQITKDFIILNEFIEGGRLRLILDMLLIAGYNIAISTFMRDEGKLEGYLKDFGNIRIDGQYIKIVKQSLNELNPQFTNRNPSIELAKHKFDINDSSNVILLDEEEDFVNAARAVGHQAYQFDFYNTTLDDLKELVRKLKGEDYQYSMCSSIVHILAGTRHSYTYNGLEDIYKQFINRGDKTDYPMLNYH
jgi:hypothetical protein